MATTSISDPETKFVKFKAVIYELQEKRNEVLRLKTQLNETITKNVDNVKEIQQQRELIESLKGQLRVLLSSINKQQETKAAITAAPDKVHLQLMEKEIERLTKACDEVKLKLMDIQSENEALTAENDKLRQENEKYETENKEITEKIEQCKTEFQKLDDEQKFVRNLITNKIDEQIRQNAALKQQIEMLEKEKQAFVEEKINSHVTKPATTSENVIFYQEIIQKLKSELESERNEKLKLQETLKKSVEIQERILTEFKVTEIDDFND